MNITPVAPTAWVCQVTQRLLSPAPELEAAMGASNRLSARVPLEPDIYGVISSADGTHSRSALAHAIRTGRLVRVRRGLYVPAEVWDAGNATYEAVHRRHVIAAHVGTLATRNAFASHYSAALIAGLPTWRPVGQTPCLTLPRRSQATLPGLHIHRALVPASHIARGPLRSLSVARTVLDLAREHRLRDAVVAGDYALAEGLTTLDDLHRTGQDCFRFPGIVRARHMIELLDARAESPLESVSRLVLNRLRFPAPVPQVPIYDRAGQFLGRSDFYWHELGIVGEADGRSKYTDAAVLWEEKRRQDALTAEGLVVVRWGAAEVREPTMLLGLLLDAAAKANRRRPGDRQWQIAA